MFDNLGHYIRELIKGNNFFSPKVICRYSIITLATMHLLNGVFFFFASSILLMIVNLAISAMLFSTMLPLIEKHELINVYILLLLDLVIIIFVENLLLGWDSGYSSYYYTAVASTFYFSYLNKSKDGSRHALPLALSLLIILCYLFNYFLTEHIQPILPISSMFWHQALFFFNTVAAFAIMIVFSYLFIWEIQHKNNILTDQNALLDELAHKDPLTKLLNRRSMNELINERMEQLKKSGKRFTMILGDIDDFKKVNDTYGHDAGDQVLIAVADTISRFTSLEDAVCRWGGEEILILITDPIEMAAVKAEKIRKAIEENVVNFEGRDIQITMTFGIAESIPGYKIEHLIQQADDKLYYGKKHGKNRVVIDLRPLD